MGIELEADGPFQRGQALAEAGFELGHLQVDLEHLAPGGDQRQEVDVPDLIIAGGHVERFPARGRMLFWNSSRVAR